MTFKRSKKKKKRVKSWIIAHVFIKYYITSARNRPARRRSSLLKPGIRQEINRERVSCDAQFFNARYFQSAETQNSRTRPSFKERPHLNVCSTLKADGTVRVILCKNLFARRGFPRTAPWLAAVRAWNMNVDKAAGRTSHIVERRVRVCDGDLEFFTLWSYLCTNRHRWVKKAP